MNRFLVILDSVYKDVLRKYAVVWLKISLSIYVYLAPMLHYRILKIEINGSFFVDSLYASMVISLYASMVISFFITLLIAELDFIFKFLLGLYSKWRVK